MCAYLSGTDLIRLRLFTRSNVKVKDIFVYMNMKIEQMNVPYISDLAMAEA